MKRVAAGPWATYRAKRGLAEAMSAKASIAPRSSVSAYASVPAIHSAALSDPAPVSTIAADHKSEGALLGWLKAMVHFSRAPEARIPHANSL
jgi:hypothetical protein